MRFSSLGLIIGTGLIKKLETVFLSTVPHRTKRIIQSDEILTNLLFEKNIETQQDWREVRKRIIESNSNISPVNVDAQTLNFCTRHEKYDLACSYMNFLKAENIRPNLATLGHYFRLIYLMNCDKQLTDGQEEEIFALYKELRKTNKILDVNTLNHLIHALSISRHWKECLKLLEEIKTIYIPISASYSVLIKACFNNREFNLGWNLLEEMIEYNRIPPSSVYLSYLEQFSANILEMERLFEFFNRHDIKCDEMVVQQIYQNYKQLNCVLTTVDNKGVCKNCGEKLQKLQITQEEFNILKAEFFKKAIIGKDVFRKSNPTELKQFEDFIKHMQPFDVVIDGLNVAYSSGVKPPLLLSNRLAAVVQYFVQKNKNILVLGRNHMKKWPNWSKISKQVTVFLTQDLSQDDPYLLYCALSSGLDTTVVSRDLMRGHIFLLKNDHYKSIMSRWLVQSQYQLVHVNNDGRVFFQYPLPYMRTAHKINGRWHIPYEIPDTTTDSPSNSWLCLQME